jgi:hypothetical protein
MADRWKVNDGRQVVFMGKLYEPGDEFAASEDDVENEGATAYVSKVRQQSAPKAANKAVAKPEPQEAKGSK